MTVVAPTDAAVERYCASVGVSKAWFMASYTAMRDSALYSVWPGVALKKVDLVVSSHRALMSRATWFRRAHACQLMHACVHHRRTAKPL